MTGIGHTNSCGFRCDQAVLLPALEDIAPPLIPSGGNSRTANLRPPNQEHDRRPEQHIDQTQ